MYFVRMNFTYVLSMYVHTHANIITNIARPRVNARIYVYIVPRKILSKKLIK